MGDLSREKQLLNDVRPLRGEQVNSVIVDEYCEAIPVASGAFYSKLQYDIPISGNTTESIIGHGCRRMWNGCEH